MDIKKLFKQYGMDYTYFKDGVYNGDVGIQKKTTHSLKMFKDMGVIKITGNLYCSNNQLTSLEYCPAIGGHLYCHNNQLTSLEHCPAIGGYLDCRYNQLTDIPYGFNHPLDRLYCDDAVKLGYNYKLQYALHQF